MRLTVTGSGTPLPAPGRAGPGALVEANGARLQFDAGRATVLRLTEAGVPPSALAALFLTHHHSDHLMDVADVVLTRWVTNGALPFPVVAPEGPAAAFVRALASTWRDDIEVRRAHGRRPSGPAIDLVAFVPTERPAVVWEAGGVTVRAVRAHHEPVVPAVAYRVEGPGGSIVVSGDTRVCAEVATLAEGCDVMLHEVVRRDLVLDAGMAHVAAYHADALELGTMAAALSLKALVLTHLEPSPRDDADARGLIAAVRRGGYRGALVVAHDLLSIDTLASIW